MLSGNGEDTAMTTVIVMSCCLGRWLECQHAEQLAQWCMVWEDLVAENREAGRWET